MDQQKIPLNLFLCLVFCLIIISCNNSQPGDRIIVTNPDEMDQQTSESIKQDLAFAFENKGKLNDSVKVKLLDVVNNFYKSRSYAVAWSHKGKWQPLTDTIYRFIENAEQYGLFPADYHLKDLKNIKTALDNDSLKRMDAAQWSRADLVLTDAFMYLVKDLKNGRLGTDTVFQKKEDSTAKANFYTTSLNEFLKDKNFTKLAASLEPTLRGYNDLKRSLAHFLDSMDRRVYTYVTYPYKANDPKDSLFFIKLLQKRLKESDCIEPMNKLPDSLQLYSALKKYQKLKGIKVDGKVSALLVRSMNNNDVERFKRIAINLDRYKQMPDKMPDKYIWVNLPAYYLKVYEGDSIALESKVICGTPKTRTPLLYSVISDMVTYPTWTVPNSIIKKQYLPKLKSNPYYLSRIGLRLVDSKGETVDPGTVNWSKYSKGIPYKVVQGSGDDNALGILKFNFKNPYSVYLHDTNQRYLFKNSARALSHGCVRVEQWDKLAFYIARNDSMNVKPGNVLTYNTDSIKNWLANKERKRIGVKNGIPLFIAYFSCEAKGNKIKFYDDIYGEDKEMREKFFQNK